jgi:hypothetical protein
MRPGARWVRTRVDVPQWITAGIGRIVVEFSDLEAQFEETMRMLLETDVKRARIVATGMSLRTRGKVAANLACAHKLAKRIAQLEAFARRAENLKTDRDMLAHGLWAKVEIGWIVAKTSGARKMPEQGSVSRAFLPQPVLITRRKLAAMRADVRALRREMRKMHTILRAELPSSPHRPPTLHRQKSLRRARTKKNAPPGREHRERNLET